jgi:hypothetical protein
MSIRKIDTRKPHVGWAILIDNQVPENKHRVGLENTIEKQTLHHPLMSK